VPPAAAGPGFVNFQITVTDKHSLTSLNRRLIVVSNRAAENIVVFRADGDYDQTTLATISTSDTHCLENGHRDRADASDGLPSADTAHEVEFSYNCPSTTDMSSAKQGVVYTWGTASFMNALEVWDQGFAWSLGDTSADRLEYLVANNPGATVCDDQWHGVRLVYDAGVARAYQDGALLNAHTPLRPSDPVADAVAVATGSDGTSDFCFGGARMPPPAPPRHRFNGAIRNFKVTKRSEYGYETELVPGAAAGEYTSADATRCGAQGVDDDLFYGQSGCRFANYEYASVADNVALAGVYRYKYATVGPPDYEWGQHATLNDASAKAASSWQQVAGEDTQIWDVITVGNGGSTATVGTAAFRTDHPFPIVYSPSPSPPPAPQCVAADETANLLAGATASTATATEAGSDVGAAVDETPASAWVTQTGVAAPTQADPIVVQVDLGAPAAVCMVDLRWASGFQPRAYEVHASTDATSSPLDRVAHADLAGQPEAGLLQQRLTLPQGTTARYLRLVVTHWDAAQSQMQLAEVLAYAPALAPSAPPASPPPPPPPKLRLATPPAAPAGPVVQRDSLVVERESHPSAGAVIFSNFLSGPLDLGAGADIDHAACEQRCIADHGAIARYALHIHHTGPRTCDDRSSHEGVSLHQVSGVGLASCAEIDETTAANGVPQCAATTTPGKGLMRAFGIEPARAPRAPPAPLGKAALPGAQALRDLLRQVLLRPHHARLARRLHEQRLPLRLRWLQRLLPAPARRAARRAARLLPLRQRLGRLRPGLRADHGPGRVPRRGGEPGREQAARPRVEQRGARRAAGRQLRAASVGGPGAAAGGRGLPVLQAGPLLRDDQLAVRRAAVLGLQPAQRDRDKPRQLHHDLRRLRRHERRRRLDQQRHLGRHRPLRQLRRQRRPARPRGVPGGRVGRVQGGCAPRPLRGRAWARAGEAPRCGAGAGARRSGRSACPDAEPHFGRARPRRPAGAAPALCSAEDGARAPDEAVDGTAHDITPPSAREGSVDRGARPAARGGSASPALIQKRI
jgi:hypothetical protein